MLRKSWGTGRVFGKSLVSKNIERDELRMENMKGRLKVCSRDNCKDPGIGLGLCSVDGFQCKPGYYLLDLRCGIGKV